MLCRPPYILPTTPLPSILSVAAAASRRLRRPRAAACSCHVRATCAALPRSTPPPPRIHSCDPARFGKGEAAREALRSPSPLPRSILGAGPPHKRVWGNRPTRQAHPRAPPAFTPAPALPPSTGPSSRLPASPLRGWHPTERCRCGAGPLGVPPATHPRMPGLAIAPSPLLDAACHAPQGEALPAHPV
ncbi:MAG: hypothetical protein J3K34DRAFT_422196 [Monoraphidium minutum]|nr:MAG: hypothetical protein J3K34DRAFT_422196 [Monoraphidium minutum]